MTNQRVVGIIKGKGKGKRLFLSSSGKVRKNRYTWHSFFYTMYFFGGLNNLCFRAQNTEWIKFLCDYYPGYFFSQVSRKLVFFSFFIHDSNELYRCYIEKIMMNLLVTSFFTCVTKQSRH